MFSFENNGDKQVYIGSADMMHRNLDRRVEALVRLVDPDHLSEIDDLFELAMSEGTTSWSLDESGVWTRHSTGPDDERLIDMQDELMHRISRRKRPGTTR